MSKYKWEEILRNSVVNNKIRATHLKHIPKLKDCEDWKQASFLGRVKYEFKYSSYNGGLVKFGGKLFYINEKQIQVLSTFLKWNTSNVIEVIDADDE